MEKEIRPVLRPLLYIVHFSNYIQVLQLQNNRDAGTCGCDVPSSSECARLSVNMGKPSPFWTGRRQGYAGRIRMSRRGGLDSVRFSRLLPNPQDNSLCSAITVYYIIFYYLPFHSPISLDWGMAWRGYGGGGGGSPGNWTGVDRRWCLAQLAGLALGSFDPVSCVTARQFENRSILLSPTIPLCVSSTDSRTCEQSRAGQQQNGSESSHVDVFVRRTIILGRTFIITIWPILSVRRNYINKCVEICRRRAMS